MNEVFLQTLSQELCCKDSSSDSLETPFWCSSACVCLQIYGYYNVTSHETASSMPSVKLLEPDWIGNRTIEVHSLVLLARFQSFKVILISLLCD